MKFKSTDFHDGVSHNISSLGDDRTTNMKCTQVKFGVEYWKPEVYNSKPKMEVDDHFL